jgi:GT2 family glycosyltransferase
MEAAKPRISIVIPTMGRAILIQTLESLVRTERMAETEIVVVGPVADPDVSRRLAEQMAVEPRIRHLAVSFPKGDASLKRNVGAQESRADIVAFLDDDVYVPPGWTDRVLEAFDDREVGMVSGPSLVPPEIPLFARLAGLALSSRAAGYVAQRYTKGSSGIRRVKWSRIIGCNMIFRREAFERIGGFDPAFYPGEEMIASAAVGRAGYALAFHPEAHVYHYPKHTFQGFWRQIFRYGATRVRLIRAGLEMEKTPLVPGLWVLSLALLGIGAAWCHLCLWLLLLDLFLYALAALYVTLSVVAQTRRASDLLLLLLQPFMHMSYGLGIWFELLRPGVDLSDKIGKPNT